MTEYEINKAVAEKLGVKVYERSAGMLFTATKHRGEYTFTRFDPCNDVQQAWEIMLANDIAIMREGDYFYALYNVYHCGNGVHRAKRVSHRNEKPFVAAMLLFLEI